MSGFEIRMPRINVGMRQLIIKATTLLLLTMNVAAHAQGPGWVKLAKVQKIVVVVNGGINVRLIPELQGCTSQSGYGQHYGSVYPQHPGIERIHAVLLAAYMADKPVAIYLSDDTCKIVEVELGGR